MDFHRPIFGFIYLVNVYGASSVCQSLCKPLGKPEYIHDHLRPMELTKRQSLFDSQLRLRFCYQNNDRTLTEDSYERQQEDFLLTTKDKPPLLTGDRNLRVESIHTFNRIHYGREYIVFQVKDNCGQ